jgi:hypothetical protein
LSTTSKPNTQAEANFKKMQQAREGELARIQYENEGIALRERTAQLRALRLAKEAELAAAAAIAPVARVKTVTKTAAKTATKPRKARSS